MITTSRSIAIVVGCMAAISAAAQDYPSRPIRFIVPNAPGGGADIMARFIKAGMSPEFSQRVVIEYKPGAASVVGLSAVASAPPDGYTIGVAANDITMAPASVKDVTFDPSRDFTAIAKVAEGAMTLVAHSSVPFNDVKGLIAYAKANPGKVNFGAPTTELVYRLFNAMAGVNITVVPYKGNAPVLMALQGNQVQLSIVGSNGGLVAAGKLRMLATTGPRRHPDYPDTPTISESGVPGYVYTWWFGVVGPAKLPPRILARLSQEVLAGTRSPDFIKQVPQFGGRAAGSSPEVLAEAIKTETAQWTRVAREAGVVPN